MNSCVPPVKDKFKIELTPADVVKPTVLNIMSKMKNRFLSSESDRDDNETSMEFIDKNMELEMGWAVN